MSSGAAGSGAAIQAEPTQGSARAWSDARDGADGRGAMREDKNRLVLACSPDSVASVRRALPTLLTRFRDEPPATPDELRLTNDDERRIWRIVLAHLRRAFGQRDGDPAGVDALTGVLSIM